MELPLSSSCAYLFDFYWLAEYLLTYANFIDEKVPLYSVFH